MREKVDKILLQYGQEVTLRSGDTTKTVRCFFQPVNFTSWLRIENSAMPLGENSRGRYTYIGQADVPVKEGDVLVVGDREYLMRRVDPYYYHREVVYLWALCVEKGGDDTWKTQS